MRWFNPNTMTEVIPDFQDTRDAIQLPDDNWFFTMDHIPAGKQLATNERGEPVLIDVA